MTIRVVARRDPSYPAELCDLPSPPDPLYVLGSLDVLARPVIAVVGTRNSTPYGERVAREICTALSRGGACLISGMARGIDAIAHRAALAEHGRTAAVLGTGVDIAYPAGHRELRERIASKGVLLSEFPAGQHPHRGSFPRRNRLIAALASVTIVVEAPRDSGALITAGVALDLGRVVAAVPGPIDSAESEGTNYLIREGAHPIASVEDALALAGITPPPRSSHPDFGEAEERVLAELRRAPADLDALATRTRLPARECIRAVTRLELAGAVECALTGQIRRR